MTRHFTLEKLNEVAADFLSHSADVNIFAFHGEMGSGKTTIITAICRKMGISETVSSPTFSIINEYNYINGNELKKIYHVDLYRLNSLEEVIDAGVEDCLYSGSRCFIEWPEKAAELFDSDVAHVFITSLSEKERKLHLVLPDSKTVV